MTAANSLNISEAGFQSFDGTKLFKGRTLTQGTGITITNADGVAGNPTIAVTGGAAVTAVATSNATPQFVLAGSTETVNFGITNLILGNSAASITGGAASNVGLGFHVFNALTSGGNNVAIGENALLVTNTGALHTVVGSQAGAAMVGEIGMTAVGYGALNKATLGANTAVGASALSQTVTGIECVAVGYAALINATSSGHTAVGHNALDLLVGGSGNNTAIGSEVATSLVSGANNVFIGRSTGTSYTGSESSNILIANSGTVGESNVMRLGTQGSGAAQQLQTHIAGVINTVSGRVVKTTVPGAYPYTTLTTDYVILVDTASARTINLVASPVTGTTYRIKDNVGTAAAFNITITPAAGLIDGVASLIVNTNWGSVDLIYNGSAWRVV